MTDTTHNLTPTANTVGVPPTPPEAHLQAVQAPKKGKDLKQDITDKIIELMQAGPAQWQKTWAVAAANGMPVNATSGAPYRGVNILLLWVATADAGYTTNRWMTYKQAQAVGANVRKGEKSVTCVFFDMIKKKEAQDDEAQFFPMAKSFHLFNLGANRENGKNRALRRFGRAYRPQTIPRSRLANALTLYCIVDIYDRGRSLLGKIKDVERAADGSSRGRQRRSDNLSARRLSPQRVQTHPHRAGEWAVHRPRLRVLQAPIRLL
ncbi:ArdC family protein [Pusillimonas sp. 7-48]|uniref:ArdC family protein n=1 Tax=Pusillimonas minor TaxID=2697024 RepID=A0A842HMK8_9BURK|nr:ArdC family protein [Pusillimonas minor]